MKYTTTESQEPPGVEETGCKIYSGAPTVSQTTGQMKVKVKGIQPSKAGSVGVCHKLQPSTGTKHQRRAL